jgi:hypothetical protein
MTLFSAQVAMVVLLALVFIRVALLGSSILTTVAVRFASVESRLVSPLVSL